MTAEPSTLARALVAAQARMPAVAKDSDNPHFHSKFTSLDSLIAATRPLLNDAGLAITQFPGVNEAGLPVLRTTITHGPSGEEVTGETPLYLSRQDMQGLGAAITYARRYAWAAMLGIASEEDTDGNTPGSKPDQTGSKPDQPAQQQVRMATKPQKARMAIVVKALGEDGVPLPPEYAGAEHWTDVLRMRIGEAYGVTTRTDLTAGQASAVIDWLEAQAIPF